VWATTSELCDQLLCSVLACMLVLLLFHIASSSRPHWVETVPQSTSVGARCSLHAAFRAASAAASRRMLASNVRQRCLVVC
jgi:hypothetical protein